MAITRRSFVVGASLTPLVPLLVRMRPAAAAPAAPSDLASLRFLTAHEGAVVVAATARLMVSSE